ncbi:MAG: phosphatase PAP2 family protein [Nitrospirae bacterium]|nr:phosphatase PAP2 family protein [Nitrospirota bacterium]
MKLLRALRPAESLSILFLFSLIAVSAGLHERLSHAKVLILTYSALFGVQLVLIANREALVKKKSMDVFCNVAFPVLCVIVIFDSLGWIVHDINPRDIDPLLIRLDYLLFNGYPTVMLESLQSPLLTDILQVAYSTYYFLPVSLGLILKLRGSEREFDKTVFMVLLCFYLSYVGYMLFPALGPRFTMRHLQSTELRGLFVAEQVQTLLNTLEGIKRDAFPSGHTAVALVVLGLAYRFHKGFFAVALPVVALLIFSTVYCRYHYVVDVIGGVILAGITFFIGEKYYGYWEVRNDISR